MNAIRLFLYIVCFGTIPFVPGALAQNLLQNGGFEKHGPLDCLCPMWPEQYEAILSGWKFMNGCTPVICDCQRKNDPVAADQGNCPFNKLSPYEGCNMIEMEYAPSCYDQEKKTRGCSSYLGARLNSPLEIGKTYEVSFWLYIPSPADSGFEQQIGINLYPEMPYNPQGRMLEGSKFLIDTLVYNQWYQAKWVFRPLCHLQFFVLGVFRGMNKLVVNELGHHNRFYVDQVQIKPWEAQTEGKPLIIPYCKYQTAEQAGLPTPVEGLTCYFASGDSILSAADERALDSFAVRVQKSPMTPFMIYGNTDDEGSNHLELSKARVKSVLDYLEGRHRIPKFKFFQAYLGDTNPVISNDTEEGRKANRRVDIRATSAEMADVIYRNLLLEVFVGEKDEAFKLVQIWLRIAKDHKKIYLLFDPRIQALHSDRRWKLLVLKKVKESYQTYKQPTLAYLLDSLGKEDQKSRTLSYYIENLNAYLQAVDGVDKRFDVQYYSDGVAPEIRYAGDGAHYAVLKTLIGDHHWPKTSEVGERSTKSAFYILAHSDDTLGMVHYLPLIKKCCEEGEAEWLHYAMLYDRLQVSRGIPQRFGTQYKPPKEPEAKLELFPLEDETKVNQWRQELGLEPLETTKQAP